MGNTIDKVLERAYLWVCDNVPGRGYGTNWGYTRLLDELSGDPDKEDKPFSETVGPYLLNSGVEERVLMGGDKNKWYKLREIREWIDPDFPEKITKRIWRREFIILNLGRLPRTDLWFISQYSHSKEPDEFGREGGQSFLKAVLLYPEDYKRMLSHLMVSPNAARELFRGIASGLLKRCSLPGEAERPVILTYPKGLEDLRR